MDIHREDKLLDRLMLTGVVLAVLLAAGFVAALIRLLWALGTFLFNA